MNDAFKPGELVAYVRMHNTRFAPIEIGVVKRMVDDENVFVYYSQGDTAALTSVRDLRHVENPWVLENIKERMEELKNENI